MAILLENTFPIIEQVVPQSDNMKSNVIKKTQDIEVD